MNDLFTEEIFERAKKSKLYLNMLEQQTSGHYAVTANSVFDQDIPVDFSSEDALEVNTGKKRYENYHIYFEKKKNVIQYLMCEKLDKKFLEEHKYNILNYIFFENKIEKIPQESFDLIENFLVETFKEISANVRGKEIIPRYLDCAKGLNHYLLSENNNLNTNCPSDNQISLISSIIQLGQYNYQLSNKVKYWSLESNEKLKNNLPLEYHNIMNSGYYDKDDPVVIKSLKTHIKKYKDIAYNHNNLDNNISFIVDEILSPQKDITFKGKSYIEKIISSNLSLQTVNKIIINTSKRIYLNDYSKNDLFYNDLRALFLLHSSRNIWVSGGLRNEDSSIMTRAEKDKIISENRIIEDIFLKNIIKKHKNHILLNESNSLCFLDCALQSMNHEKNDWVDFNLIINSCFETDENEKTDEDEETRKTLNIKNSLGKMVKSFINKNKFTEKDRDNYPSLIGNIIYTDNIIIKKDVHNDIKLVKKVSINNIETSIYLSKFLDNGELPDFYDNLKEIFVDFLNSNKSLQKKTRVLSELMKIDNFNFELTPEMMQTAMPLMQKIVLASLADDINSNNRLESDFHCYLLREDENFSPKILKKVLANIFDNLGKKESEYLMHRICKTYEDKYELSNLVTINTKSKEDYLDFYCLMKQKLLRKGIVTINPPKLDIDDIVFIYESSLMKRRCKIIFDSFKDQSLLSNDSLDIFKKMVESKSLYLGSLFNNFFSEKNLLKVIELSEILQIMKDKDPIMFAVTQLAINSENIDSKSIKMFLPIKLKLKETEKLISKLKEYEMNFNLKDISNHNLVTYEPIENKFSIKLIDCIIEKNHTFLSDLSDSEKEIISKKYTKIKETTKKDIVLDNISTFLKLLKISKKSNNVINEKILLKLFQQTILQPDNNDLNKKFCFLEKIYLKSYIDRLKEDNLNYHANKESILIEYKLQKLMGESINNSDYNTGFTSGHLNKL